ncbi:MAG: amino acid adenylation domain-containing protein [Kofleriaceae bacterium]
MTQEHLDGYRISPQQLRIWRLGGARPSAAGLVICDGISDVERLHHALARVVARHEILRTVFDSLAGMEIPVQRVLPAPEFAWQVEDRRGAPVEEVLATLERELRELPPADVRAGPVLRGRVVRLRDGRAALSLSLPSLCADAATLQRILVEVGTLLAGDELDDDEEVLQYADFAEWQATTSAEPEAEYWKRLALPDAAHRLRSAGDHPSRDELVTVDLALAPELTDRIRAFLVGVARSAGGAPLDEEAFWFAAWMVFARRSVDAEVITSLRHFSSRTEAPLEGALGPIDRYLPVFYRPNLEGPFAAALTELAVVVADLDAHKLCFDWPHVSSAGDESTPRALAFALRRYADVRAPAGRGTWRLSWRAAQVLAETVEVELEVCVRGEPARAERLVLRARGELLDRVAARRALEGVLALVEDVLRDPRRPLRELETLGRAERAFVLDALGSQGGVAAPLPTRAPSLCQRISAVASEFPDRPALIFEAERVSYRELWRRSAQLAAALRARGVGPDRVVPLLMDRSIAGVLGLVGVLAAGGAYAPLDPHAPERRLRTMLGAMRDGPVLTTARWRELVLRLGVDAARIIVLEEVPTSDEPAALEVPSPHSAAYVIYTSGSTGVPKGVVVTHAGLENLAAALEARVYAELGAPLRVSLNAPLVFDASIKQLVQLGGGHTLVLVPDQARPDGQALLALMAAQRLDVLDVTPAQVELLLHAGLEREVAALPRRMVIGGEAISASTWTRLRALGATRFVNVYGPTECADVATVATLEDTEAPVIGGPLAGVRVYVLDAHGLPVPAGAPGELYLGGAGVARGYLASPGQTAGRFVPDPFSGVAGARLYRTGDRARWRLDAGGRDALEFLGRVDHQIKLRGFRVELGDIEATLRQLPSVHDCVVVLREDRPGDPHLVAYLVSRAAAPPSPDDVLRHAREHLPEYMVPAAVVLMERLPLSRNGKVDRAALPPPPETADVGPAPFLSPVEGILWGIWVELLGASRVGLDEDFFANGGHSLLATQLVARIREALTVELPLRVIFEEPTLRRLALAVERERARRQEGGPRAEPPRLVPVPRGGDLPLSFAQLRLWLAYQLDPRDTSYNAPAAFQIDGPLDPELLERALSTLIVRHELLRTTFEVRGERPVQVIHEPAPFSLPQLDLSSLSPEDQARQLDARLHDLAARPFSLERGPLLHLELIRMAPQRHVVSLDMHHIIRDAWSTAIFVRELLEVYGALVARRPIALPELPIQYADFAHWQTSWLSGDVYRAHLDYWKRQLAGELPVLELPLDRPRERRAGHRGRRAIFALDGELAEGLRGLALRSGATLYMTMLAGFVVLLHRFKEQRELLVGMAIAGRDRRETEHLLGCLINMLVLRFDLGDAPTFDAVLRQVRQVTLEAYEHQAMPFDHLVKELAPPRRPGLSPFFQVAFGLQNAPLGELSIPGLELTPLLGDEEQVRYDLTVWVHEEPPDREGRAGLSVDWTYSDELFDASTIERLARQYHQLLRGVVADPHAAIHSYPLQSTEERAAQADQQAQKQRSLSSRLSASRRKP